MAQTPSVLFCALLMTDHDAFSMVGVSVSPSCWMSTASMSLLLSAFANRFAWIGLTLCFSSQARHLSQCAFTTWRQCFGMVAGGYHVGKRQVIALLTVCAGDREEGGQASLHHCQCLRLPLPLHPLPLPVNSHCSSPSSCLQRGTSVKRARSVHGGRAAAWCWIVPPVPCRLALHLA